MFKLCPLLLDKRQQWKSYCVIYITKYTKHCFSGIEEPLSDPVKNIIHDVELQASISGDFRLYHNPNHFLDVPWVRTDHSPHQRCPRESSGDGQVWGGSAPPIRTVLGERLGWGQRLRPSEGNIQTRCYWTQGTNSKGPFGSLTTGAGSRTRWWIYWDTMSW